MHGFIGINALTGAQAKVLAIWSFQHHFMEEIDHSVDPLLRKVSCGVLVDVENALSIVVFMRVARGQQSAQE